MTASVASFLTKAQKKGSELPGPLSGALLLAAIRLSEAKAQAVRPYQLLVDDDGNLDLLSGEPPTGDAYAAPELRNGAVLPDDPRVLVYAAGALGYELATLASPPGGEAVGEELQGPLAKIIRRAMAERQKRFRNLTEMLRAIEAVQGRTSKDEERLILSAVAASTPLPPAQKLAKIELGKAVGTEPGQPPAPEPAPPASSPVFTELTGPMEPQLPRGEKMAAAPPEPLQQPPDLAPLQAEIDGERRARVDLSAAVHAQIQELAHYGTRLALMEEQVRGSVAAAPLSAAAALLRDVNHLLEQRRFGEAERLLRDPIVQDNAPLQLRLGQALSSLSNASGSALARALAAFERASTLDPSWAQPRVELAALSLRLGKRAEAVAHWKEALRLDPGSPQALAALSVPRRSPVGYALAGAGGAIATAFLVVLLRPVPPPAAAPAPAVVAAAVAPAPASRPAPPPPPTPTSAAEAAPKASAPAAAAQPLKLPVPELKLTASPEVQAARPPRSETRENRESKESRESKPRPKKVASSGGRGAAEAETARGDKALRAFDTKAAEAAFSSALKLDPMLPAAHRGMGMVYVLLGKNAEAKASYARYLELAPDAPDRDQIARLLSR
ncbi:MAG TPA: tetratricopeptide repeat protein [Myxococcales bacterium]|nr:tetratricopeptide repeat protein [Myxococcales bacterium]